MFVEIRSANGWSSNRQGFSAPLRRSACVRRIEIPSGSTPAAISEWTTAAVILGSLGYAAPNHQHHPIAGRGGQAKRRVI